jgi:hypothetical protein
MRRDERGPATHNWLGFDLAAICTFANHSGSIRGSCIHDQGLLEAAKEQTARK